MARSPAETPMVLMCYENWGLPRKKHQAYVRSSDTNAGSTTEVRSEKPWGWAAWVLPWRGRGAMKRPGQGGVRPPTPLLLKKKFGEGEWAELRKVGITKTAWRGQVNSSPPRNGMSNLGDMAGVCVSYTSKTHSCGLEWGESGSLASSATDWLYDPQFHTGCVILKREMFTL